jgi:O-methyltransferase involved in polyketide biosynthesis
MATVAGETLDGVSATTLWTLRNRATEAKRPDGVISDPWAIRLFESISHAYSKFGRHSQTHALRALAFDNAARNYLRMHPKASVVALAEGLQTSFWRLDRAGVADQLTWYSLDLPPVTALRHKLLPRDPRVVELAQSALDRSWMERISTAHGAFITAEGLLMYLTRADALGLIADCAARFAGGRMVFDTIPRWVSRRSLKGMNPPSAQSVIAHTCWLMSVPGRISVYPLLVWHYATHASQILMFAATGTKDLLSKFLPVREWES